MPEQTEAQKKAHRSYIAKFARLEIRTTIEQREAIQSHATSYGESVNGFIGRAISEAMERDSSGTAPESPQDAPESTQVALPSETVETAQRAAEATGETVGEFLTRAVETQAQRDRSSLALGINPATGGKLEKEA